MHACFLLHPGLCPGRGWTRDTERAGGSYSGLSFGTQRKSFSSSHPPNRLPAPERGGLSWPPEREVWKLASGVVRPTGTRHWAAAVGRSRDSGHGHIGTWVQIIVAWLRWCTQVAMSPKDWIKFLDTPSQGPKNGELPGWGRGAERKAPRNSPNFRSPSSRSLGPWRPGGAFTWACEKQKQDFAAGGPWTGGGDGHPAQSRPLLPRLEHCQSLPPGSGAPNWLCSSPTQQLEVVNCSHCPERTNEAPGSVPAQGAFCSLQPFQPGMGCLFPPQRPAVPVRPQWLQTPGSGVGALACQRAAAQMSPTSLTGSRLSCARSGPVGRQRS